MPTTFGILYATASCIQRSKINEGGERILNSCKIFSRVSKGHSGVRRGAPAYSAAKSTLLRIWDM